MAIRETADSSAAAFGIGTRKRSLGLGPRRVRILRRRLFGLIYVVGFLLCLVAIFHASYDFFLRTPYFLINSVEITGVSDPLKLEIQALIDTALQDNRNLLRLNTTSLRRLISRHPRVANLDLRKVYPDRLIIAANEREPAVLLAAGDAIYLLDWEGHVMEQAEPVNLRNVDLPFISGIPSDDVQVGEKIYNPELYKALDLTRVLKERNPDVYSRLSEVQIANDPVSHLESIVAHLVGGMEIRFGDGNPMELLPGLEVWAETVRQKGADPYQMAYVDLRFKDRVFHMDRETAMALEAGIPYSELEAVQKVETDTSKDSSKRGENASSPGASTQPRGASLYELQNQNVRPRGTAGQR